ncbi:MAG: glycosyltransferase [Coriobacteriia bacterium]|nr:glycosyltransferase [Coriobacteriia bacterium]MCL2750050.1 glycosyltransferase [Coriobacteriia bacterium]
MPESPQILTNTSIVIVTYKRLELLEVLLNSIKANTLWPKRIYVVDNDASNEVGELAAKLEASMPGSTVSWVAMPSNTGGSGGFSKGVELAYQDGAEWIWLMDDDVVLLPEALEKLTPWMQQAEANNHLVIQGCRLNFDDSAFYWQYHFINKLGIPNPIAPSQFKKDELFKPMNTACFEGGLFNRKIVEQIGIPDPRFFIYWDDTIYGYLASKITQPILIRNMLMQRTRHIANIRLGSVRKLNSTSNMVRYYIMRNRGYMARYLQLYGDYHPLLWSIGTAATFAKEFIRLFITKEFKEGLPAIRKGMKDARIILKDPNWQPMPPLNV